MTLASAGPVALVGAGNMGRALLEGWLGQGLQGGNVYVHDPAPGEASRALIERHGLKLNSAIADMPDPQVVVFAVKPQVMDQVLAKSAGLVRKETLVLSVAAGRTMAGIAARLPAGTAIVRTIPNTPASIGQGMTVACANKNVTRPHRVLADALLSAVGSVGWVDDEALIDAATAVSGSGPAYVFYLAECLARAGVAAGLPEALADQAARETVAGAGALLRQSGFSAAELRSNVTSPGGTTAAALEILAGEEGLSTLMEKAVAAAAKRSKDLSG